MRKNNTAPIRPRPTNPPIVLPAIVPLDGPVCGFTTDELDGGLSSFVIVAEEMKVMVEVAELLSVVVLCQKTIQMKMSSVLF